MWVGPRPSQDVSPAPWPESECVHPCLPPVLWEGKQPAALALSLGLQRRGPALGWMLHERRSGRKGLDSSGAQVWWSQAVWQAPWKELGHMSARAEDGEMHPFSELCRSRAWLTLSSQPYLAHNQGA